MHSHQQIENQPVWKKMIGSVPILGAFVNTKYENPLQAVDGALYEASAITGQMTSMYLFPVKLTERFPKVSDDMRMQMHVHMGTEMALRMWIGDVAGKTAYRIVSYPIKLALDGCKKEICLDSAKDFAIKMGQILPLIGPFIGEKDWKKAIRNGFVGNIEQLAMLTGGAVFMMLSPYGMGTDATSISVGTALMTAGMTSVMLVETVGVQVLKKSAEGLTKCSLWNDKNKNKVELDPLLKDMSDYEPERSIP